MLLLLGSARQTLIDLPDKWRKGKVLDGESSDSRYVVSQIHCDQCYDWLTITD